MPFKSDEQRKYMYANHPEIAKKWEAEAKDKKGPWSYVAMPGTDDEKEKLKKSFLNALGGRG